METRLSRLGIDFPFFVGPMVGISHVAFRELVRGYMPGRLSPVLFTEMLSTRRVPSEHLDLCAQLRCAPGEPNLVPQLLGNEEEFIAASIRKLLRMKPKGFDINMGCPAKHTLRHNWGVLLMGDRKYAADVVRMAKRSSSLPVSVKLRAVGEDEQSERYLFEFTEALEEAGANWLTVHARSRDNRHSGVADWKLVGRLARARQIPVVANGDLQTAEDAIALVVEHGADGAMIGRAAAARPWILWQIAYHLGLCQERPPLSLEEESREYFNALLLFVDLLENYYGDSPAALKRLNFFIALGSQWFLFGHTFWKSVQKAKCLAEARMSIYDYRSRHEHPMRGRIVFH